MCIRDSNYTYTGTFSESPDIKSKASSWYAGGTEVIFSCGGQICNYISKHPLMIHHQHHNVNVTLEIDPKKNIAGGGLVGMNAGGSLLACYATGNVTSTGSSTGNVHMDIYESDNIKIYNIGYKLFYVNKINKK